MTHPLALPQAYEPPAVVLEVPLEVRAGTPLGLAPVDATHPAGSLWPARP